MHILWQLQPTTSYEISDDLVMTAPGTRKRFLFHGYLSVLYLHLYVWNLFFVLLNTNCLCHCDSKIKTQHTLDHILRAMGQRQKVTELYQRILRDLILSQWRVWYKLSVNDMILNWCNKKYSVLWLWLSCPYTPSSPVDTWRLLNFQLILLYTANGHNTYML